MQQTNTFFLISFRAFITSILAGILVVFFVGSLPSLHDFLKITLGSLLGVIGLLCMLKVIKKYSIQWLGIYTLLGIIITYMHMYLFENFAKKPSFLGLILLLLGYILYLIFNKKTNQKLALKTHALLLLMVFCFSYSSIVHWKNLTTSISPIIIVANQEVIVFFVSSVLLYYKYPNEIKLENYTTNFKKIAIMSAVIIIALYFNFKGIKVTDPLINGLLFLASPLTTIAFAALFFREKINSKNIIAIFLICIGALLIHLKTA
jgi:drug/metabolite transporter (DMT)-like permease